jgi:hypothetical protein
VKILKEEKTLLENKLQQIVQHNEQSRLQIEQLTRDKLAIENQPCINPVPIAIHRTDDHRFEFEQVQ